MIALLRDGSTADVTERVALRARNERVAVVEGTTIRAVGPGETEIVAEETVSRKRTRTPARVRVPRLVSLTVEPARLAVAVGETASLRALARYDDGSHDVDVSARVRWSTSRRSCAPRTA